MGRAPRVDLGDTVYHVLNRASGRVEIFHTDADYSDFEELLKELTELYEIRILAYTIMPNHWHLLVYPTKDGTLSKGLQWLSTTHSRRYRTKTGTIGYGHLYQGRYKSFVITDDSHLMSVLKYIERNPVRAKLCSSVQQWRWGSAYRRQSPNQNERSLIAESPVPLPRDYATWINEPEPSEALDKIRDTIK